MDEELPKSTGLDKSPQLGIAIASWKSWCSSLPVMQQQLGGHSNQSYLVQAAAELFVIRVNHPASHLGVDRLREKSILQLIKGADFAPEIVHWHEDFLVSRYIPREQAVSATQVSQLFSRIHRIVPPSTLGGPLQPLAHMKAYYRQLGSSTKQLESCYRRVLKLGIEEFGNSADCLCHHDLLDDNIRVSDSGIKVIDWEYARRGDPVFDLAVYAETNQLDESATRDFLDEYEGSVTPEQLHRYQILYAFIEILWWKIRHQNNTEPPKISTHTNIDVLLQRLNSAG